jgi:hypothetical protein
MEGSALTTMCSLMPASPDIDFHRIRPFQGDRRHGFEELCAQLAHLEDHGERAIFYRKGVGADAGVECFVRDPDGSEIGWQAKFFFELGDAQINQLDDSVDQALRKHPQLKQYIVCLPFNLRDARRGKSKSQLSRWEEWKAKWERKARKKRRTLTITLWDATALGARLQRTGGLYEGRSAYWFDETILTSGWFHARFEQAKANLGQRYIPETNVELPIRRILMGFCRDPLVNRAIEEWSEKLDEAGHRAIEAIRRLENAKALKERTDALEERRMILMSALNAASNASSFEYPIADYICHARSVLDAAWKSSDAIWSLKNGESNEKQRIEFAKHELRQVERATEQFIAELSSEQWQFVNPRSLLVYGDAGVGKSHLFGDAVEHQIAHERPALLILGGSLREADPWTQIIEQLGIQGISTETLLGALDAAGQAAGTRAVIFVDAINERHGIDLWATRLPGFLKSIDPYPHVAIVVSCRTTYLPYIVDNNAALGNLPRVKHVGFAGNAAAARYYLDKRGIARMAAPNLIPEFDNPLFLKTCCDSLIKRGERQFPRGMRGVTAIFEFYSEAVADAIETRLKLDRGQKCVTRFLSAFASASDEGERGYVDRDRAQAIADSILPSQGLFERNLLSQLESEGVLAIEPISDGKGSFTETARFTFERYSDHRIAHQLLEKYFDAAAPEAAFETGRPLRRYVDSEEAYQRAGVIEALATQIPERAGKELQDLVPPSRSNNFLLAQGLVRSVLWRSQSCFTERTIELLREAESITGRNEVNDTLIVIATEPENKFNAEHLHQRLMPLSLAERDHCWTVYLMHEQSDDGSHVEALISWTRENGQDEMEPQRAELAAIALSWILTVSSRVIRDKATKALATLLSVRLDLAGHLISRFAACNDDYVRERVMASAYGAALQGLKVEGLAELATAAYGVVFEPDLPVPHLLVRDYARGILELALQRKVLPQTIDMVKARPPYRSAWPLEEVSKETAENYKQKYEKGIFTDAIVGSTIHDGDFARYIIDHAVTKWSSLPITLTGLSQKEIYQRWRDEVVRSHPKAAALLVEISKVSERMRTIYASLGESAISIVFVEPGDATGNERRREEHPRITEVESDLSTVEKSLHKLIGESFWQRYKDEAQRYLHGSIHWRRRGLTWPPLFGAGPARRWICKRAHDLGWTPELFGEFERYMGSPGRMEHRVERIGKKYQWIALYELLARLSDNQLFLGWSWNDPHPYGGAWQVGCRDIDPSVLVSRTKVEAWKNWDRTWWTPVQVSMTPVSPGERLRWLHSSDEIMNDVTLIDVTDPKTNRRWLVLSEVASWHQWAMRQGDRRLERTAWFRLRSVLVKESERDALIRALSKRMITDEHDLPEVEIPDDGFLGEYPWHPAYSHLEIWSQESRQGLPVTVQPTVARYNSGISGYDFSIDDKFYLELPSPGLIGGLKLHLSDGRRMSYVNDGGEIIFRDPSVNEPGHSAALVDRKAFLDFLAREQLSCVWIVGGMKVAYGGRRHEGGWGGDRLFSSVLWLTANGFERRDKFEERKPDGEQLAIFFADETDDQIARPSSLTKQGSISKADSLTSKAKRPRSTKIAVKPLAKKKFGPGRPKIKHGHRGGRKRGRSRRATSPTTH